MDENNLIKMKEFLCFSQNTHVYIHKLEMFTKSKAMKVSCINHRFVSDMPLQSAHPLM